MKKFVVKCSLFKKRQMKKARKAVKRMSGVETVNVELKDRKLIVIGTFDPSAVMSILETIGQRKGHIELVSLLENYEEIEAGNRKRNKAAKILSNCVKYVTSAVTCVVGGFAISGAT